MDIIRFILFFFLGIGFLFSSFKSFFKDLQTKSSSFSAVPSFSGCQISFFLSYFTEATKITVTNAC